MVSENTKNLVTCKNKISDRDLIDNSDIIDPGYYWATASLKIEEHAVNG